MTKRKNFTPKPGRCDIIHGILIGGEQTKNLEKRNKEMATAKVIIKKLEAVEGNTSDDVLKEKALQAIALLKKFPSKNIVPDVDRQRIYKQVFE